LDSALRGGAVVITKHDTPKAILMSIEEFEAMTMPRQKLAALTGEFDAMYARMQTPTARAAVDKLFAAPPAELGAAAVKAARRKRERDDGTDPRACRDQRFGQEQRRRRVLARERRHLLQPRRGRPRHRRSP